MRVRLTLLPVHGLVVSRGGADYEVPDPSCALANVMGVSAFIAKPPGC